VPKFELLKHNADYFWKRTIQWLFHQNFVLFYWANGFRQEDFYGNFP
jgi:hypothetical protein